MDCSVAASEESGEQYWEGGVCGKRMEEWDAGVMTVVIEKYEREENNYEKEEEGVHCLLF
jgi:hypothetical protein